MDKSRQKDPQTTDHQVTHWLGLAIGLAGGLTIDALFGFRTGTFFTFIGIVLGMSGLLDLKER